ncbi:MAG: cell division protein FtsA [Bacteroidetes bacterium]|nr:MAG: cell division protein FtsA [Bacteroidota bacterium]TAG85901.1 MAG: cell division protein FtsA [Bacteroidota bacterium]
MSKDKIVVGLDIGTTKICALVGRKDEFGKIEILGMGKAESLGVVRGVVNNIDKTVESIRIAISEAEKQANIDIRKVNVGIAGQHIQSFTQHGGIIRKNTDQEITLEDVERLNNDMHGTVTPPGKEILHVMPQDYTIDNETGIEEPIGMSGVRLEADFNIITADTFAIRNMKRCVVDHCQLEIDNLILEPIASSMSVLTQEEKEAGVVLVDIGGGTTDVAIFYRNIIRHTAVIPYAGNIITSDIKEACKIMEAQAEKLKIKFGRAVASETSENEFVSVAGLKGRPAKEIKVSFLATVIEARMQEIIQLVHNEIIKSGYVNKLVGGIVITGGGSQLASAPNLFQSLTGMDSRIGHPNEYLGKSKIEVAKSPMYATTVGLVLAGFKTLDERLDKYSKNLPIHLPEGQKSTKQVEGQNFFGKITNSLKKFLMDETTDEKTGKY